MGNPGSPGHRVQAAYLISTFVDMAYRTYSLAVQAAYLISTFVDNKGFFEKREVQAAYLISTFVDKQEYSIFRKFRQPI